MIEYSQAANYCNKVLKNKKSAMTHLENAEKLKKSSNLYKDTGEINMAQITKQLTPEMVHGLPEEQRVKTFTIAITELNK